MYIWTQSFIINFDRLNKVLEMKYEKKNVTSHCHKRLKRIFEWNLNLEFYGSFFIRLVDFQTRNFWNSLEKVLKASQIKKCQISVKEWADRHPSSLSPFSIFCIENALKIRAQTKFQYKSITKGNPPGSNVA